MSQVKGALSTFALVTLATVVACGGQASTANPPGDADAADGQSEAGTFACGDLLCAETKVCLYPFFECGVASHPPTDAGSCPEGTVFSDANDLCGGSPGCCLGPPICPRPFSPFCGSPEQCSAQDSGLWSVVDALLDAGGSSHTCYAQPPP